MHIGQGKATNHPFFKGLGAVVSKRTSFTGPSNEETIFHGISNRSSFDRRLFKFSCGPGPLLVLPFPLPLRIAKLSLAGNKCSDTQAKLPNLSSKWGMLFRIFCALQLLIQ